MTYQLTAVPMMKFNDLKIGIRLAIGFALVLAMLVLLSIVSIGKVGIIRDDLTTINDVNSVKQRYSINFRGSVHDRAIALRDISLVSASELDAVTTNIERLTGIYDASAGPLDTMMVATGDETERAILASIKATQGKTLPLIQEVIRLRRAGDEAGARSVLMLDARPQFVEWLREINQFIDLEEAKNKEIASSARSVVDGFSLMTVLLCAGALAVGGGVAVWSIGSIRPLKRQTEVMRRLAAGDFSVEVPHMGRKDEVGDIARAVQLFKDSGIDRARLQSQASTMQQDQERRLKETEEAFQVANREQKRIVDALALNLGKLADSNLAIQLNDAVAPEYVKLKDDFNAAVSSLREAMTSILAATIELREGSIGISTASDDLSRRTEQQAASLEETAAALDAITVTVKRSAEGARQASAAASGARSGCGPIGRRHARRHRGDERDRAELRQDNQHHRCDRRDRLPDEPAGAQCWCRGGSGRRCGAWLRGCGAGGPRFSATLCRGGQGDQGSDCQQFGPGRARGEARRRNRPGLERHRLPGDADRHP